jgi:hypothetical protein
MHGLHHQLQRRFDDGARLFRIEVFDQLHRAFDVGEERRDRLAFAFEYLARFAGDAYEAFTPGQRSFLAG